MSETLIQTAPTRQAPEHYEVRRQSEDFHLPGDSHVAKNTYYDRGTGEAVRKVIRPNHLGQLEVRFVPQSEVVQVRNSESYDHLARP